MELSEFIKTRKPFPPVPPDYKESAEWEESQYFNAWIKKYPVKIQERSAKLPTE